MLIHRGTRVSPQITERIIITITAAAKAVKILKKINRPTPKVVEGSAPQADPQSALFQAVFHSPESQATWRNSAGFGNTLGSLLTFHWVAAELDRETANFCAGVAEYGDCSVAVIFPGEFGAAETSVTILEQEGNIVHLVVKTPTGGEISVITEMKK